MSKFELLESYDDMLTPKELQTILRVSRGTVSRLLDEGSIKSIKVGCSYRIPKVYLEEYLYPYQIPKGGKTV